MYKDFNTTIFEGWLLDQIYDLQRKMGGITPGEPFIISHSHDVIRIEPVELSDTFVVIEQIKANVGTIFWAPGRYDIGAVIAMAPGYPPTEPQPNHPDGWYRKFEKRQRGAKCLTKK